MVAHNVLVVGGGAAGLLAAVGASTAGAPVTILEKQQRVGTKLLITGKGRCNLTNIGDIPHLIENIPSNGHFLYSAFYAFSNQDLLDFLHSLGVETKVERGGRVFPKSDRACDVVQALENFLRRQGVTIKLNTPVQSLLVDESGKVYGVRTNDGQVTGRAVIIATGGVSYPRTGSTGDGYRLVRPVGHSIVPVRAALVPLETHEHWVRKVQGLTLKNVKATVYHEQQKVAEDFGEMLFTHFGVSGPIILTLSRQIALLLEKGKGQVSISINLKPALTPEQLDRRLQRDFAKFARKQLRNGLRELLPRRLIEPFIELSGIPGDKFIHQITREERLQLCALLQNLPLTVSKTRPIEEAIVTAGGVSVKEVDPSTMASRLVRGLYFAGEVLDIDGFTGGYNLQAAFSTGFLAGRSAASYSK